MHVNKKKFFSVTPCVGVWIETQWEKHQAFCYNVTPCVGVWIETSHVVISHISGVSHPAWVCGLKPWFADLYHALTVSHPAWVCGLKHCGTLRVLNLLRSHPAWVCGLKPRRFLMYYIFLVSHPAWVCGLKHILYYCIRIRVCHTLRGCVD